MVSTRRREPSSNLTRTPKRQVGSPSFPSMNMFSSPGNVMPVVPSIPLQLPSVSIVNPVISSSSERGPSTSSTRLSTQPSASSSLGSSSTESSTASSSADTGDVTANFPSTSTATAASTAVTPTCSAVDQLLCILSSVLSSSTQTTFSSPEPSTSTLPLFSSSPSILSPSPPSGFPSSSSLSRTSTPIRRPISTSTVTSTPITSTLSPTFSTLSTSTITPTSLPTPPTSIFSPTSTAPTPLPTPSTPILSPTSTAPTPLPTPSTPIFSPTSTTPTTPVSPPSYSVPSVLPTFTTAAPSLASIRGSSTGGLSSTILNSSSSLPASVSTPFVSSSVTATNPRIATSLPDSSSFPLTLITSSIPSVDSSTSRTSIATSSISRTSSPTGSSILDTTTILESPLPSPSSLISSLLPSSSTVPVSTVPLTSSSLIVLSSSSLILPSSLPASTTSSQSSLISSILPAPTDTSSLTSSMSMTTMFITSTAGGSVTTISTVMSSGILNTNVPNDNTNNSISRNIGAIIGIIVGALIALTFIAIWIYLAIRRRKKAQTGNQQSSSERLNKFPERGQRSSFHVDGDDEDLGPSMSTRYPFILPQIPGLGEPANHQAAEGNGEWDNDGVSSSTGIGPNANSAVSVVPSTHEHYPAFGQAADTMRDFDTLPGMTRTDSAPAISQRRRSSGGRDAFYLAGAGYTPSLASSIHVQSSTAHSREAVQYRSQNPSYDDDPFRSPPTHSSSQLASSYYEVASSSSHRRSMEATRQSPTPPGGNSHKKVASAGSERSLTKKLKGRFRSASSPTPDSAPQDGPSISSLSRHPTFVHPHSTSPSIYGATGSAYPPSSLLRPQSPHTVYSRPTYDTSEYPWPPPSLPESEDSHDIATPVGLLNPRVDQARMDSTTSFGDRFGDHTDVSRPLVPPAVAHEPSRTTYDTDDSMEHREG